MKINLFIVSVLVSQTLGFRMLRRANDWKDRGLTGMERLNQIRLQREGKALIVHFLLNEAFNLVHTVSCLSLVFIWLFAFGLCQLWTQFLFFGPKATAAVFVGVHQLESFYCFIWLSVVALSRSGLKKANFVCCGEFLATKTKYRVLLCVDCFNFSSWKFHTANASLMLLKWTGLLKWTVGTRMSLGLL